MKFTNIHNLPEAYYRAVCNDDYTAGDCDISCTSLLKAPYQRNLELMYADQIVDDCSDRVWSLMGQLGHLLLERANMELAEERLYATFCGWVLSGQFDSICMDGTVLQDYKFMSVWEIINGLKPEKEQQLNILAELAYRNGYKDIEKLQIVSILRDWSMSKAKTDRSYPQSPVVATDVKLWDQDERVEFIEHRIRLHQAAEHAPVCNAEQRWAKPDKWAIKKVGRKSAVKLHLSEEDAMAHLDMLDDKHSIEHRPGEDTRCLHYCSVNKWCKYYNETYNKE